MIPIHEVFATFQGEGVNMGRAAFFIRTFGCPVHCPWCDSAGTWHPDHVPKNIHRLSPADLTGYAVASGAPLVVITGGEPAIHDLTALTSMLHAEGKEVAIETSGAYELQGSFDHVTVSPKRNKFPLASVLKQATELKLIVDHPDAVSYWLTYLLGVANVPLPRNVWLHPEWSLRSSASILNAITMAVRSHGDPLRAGWQLHKLYRADSLDPRSAVTVPLGGNPALGPST